jgi:predicted metal-dependent phosphoesterase TrpH
MDLDLHVHSKYSYDSFSDPKKIIKYSIKKGLNGIAITDHNTIKGSIEASKYVVEDFVIIPGTEISTEAGHIIGLFLNEEIRTRLFVEVVEEIKSQDGISILAHPFKRTSEVEEAVIEKVDAIEIFNSRANTLKKLDANLHSEKIAKQYNLPVTAGSDSHFYFEIGRGRVKIDLADITDLEEIKKCILNKKVTVKGIESSPQIEMCSQIVKFIKRKRLPKLSSTRKYLNK